MRVIFIFVIFFVGVLTRFIDHPPNFTPMLSIALLSGLYIKNKWGFLLPLAIVLFSNYFLEPGSMYVMIPIYISYFLIYLYGAYFSKNTFLDVFKSSFLGAVLFFIITNFAVWINCIIFNSFFYSHDIAGLISCYYNGLPFFRNTLVSTIGFSIYFYSCYKFVFNYDNLYQSVKR